MVCGAVLAGGRSLRYGKNKALELFRGRALIDLAVESLRPRCRPVFVVANDLSPYYHVQATLIKDFFVSQGPLGGIFTALWFSPHPWVFMKATDMPILSSSLMELMISLRGTADVVVPLMGERREPLLALYSRKCLRPVAAALQKGERKIVDFYGKVRVREVPEEQWRAVDPEGVSFRNVNTPQDLEQLQWI